MLKWRHCFQDQLYHFKRSAELDFRNADAFINWGVALTILGRHEEALKVVFDVRFLEVAEACWAAVL